MSDIPGGAQTKARSAGFFWIMTIAAGMFAYIIGSRFVVAGDAVKTAGNIVAHEPLYRLGFVANIIATACYVAVTLLLYELLRLANSSISLLGAFFSLVGCAIRAVSCLLFLAPLTVLGGSKAVFTLQQLQAQALTFAILGLNAGDIGLVFFGPHLLSVGYPIGRSTFLPPILGALLAFGGVCYLTNSFSKFLALPFKIDLLPLVAAGGLLGEGSLAVWLLAKGVNVQAWNELAGSGRVDSGAARHAEQVSRSTSNAEGLTSCVQLRKS
jgi:hypothetical protein